MKDEYVWVPVPPETTKIGDTTYVTYAYTLTKNNKPIIRGGEPWVEEITVEEPKLQDIYDALDAAALRMDT